MTDSRKQTWTASGVRCELAGYTLDMPAIKGAKWPFLNIALPEGATFRATRGDGVVVKQGDGPCIMDLHCSLWPKEAAHG